MPWDTNSLTLLIEEIGIFFLGGKKKCETLSFTEPKFEWLLSLT